MKSNTYFKSSSPLWISCLLIIFFCSNANGEILFESATLVNEGTTSIYNTYVLSDGQILGSRFYLDQSAEITSIGGHFIGNYGTFFGAIIPLDSPEGFPGIGAVLESQAIAYNTFSSDQIIPSKDFRMPLSIVLDPGDYALVFGSGLFRTMGYGGAIYQGQIDYPQADFIAWEDGDGIWWNPSSNGMRFVLEGEIVPEPATLSLLVFGGLALLHRRK